MAPGRGGGRFSIENPRRGGGVFAREGGEARGREGVCGEFWGGELIFFFRGRNAHQEDVLMLGTCS